MQSGREDTLEERYAIKFCFKLGKNATEMYGTRLVAYLSLKNPVCPLFTHSREEIDGFMPFPKSLNSGL